MRSPVGDENAPGGAGYRDPWHLRNEIPGRGREHETLEIFSISRLII